MDNVDIFALNYIGECLEKKRSLYLFNRHFEENKILFYKDNQEGVT